MNSPFHEIDTVVLLHDVPTAGLLAEEVGAVVQIYAPEALEVEFVTAAGRTQALLTLQANDIRHVRDNDVLAVRPAAHLPGAD